MHRRHFLKTGAAALAAFAQTRRLFAARLRQLERTSPRGKSFETLKSRYSLDPGVIYLNHGSIGTIPKPVQEAHRRYLEICETNPWLYMWGGAWEEPRRRCREKLAALIGCDPVELAITHNTTEGFNILASGLPLGRGDEVLFSSLNHPGASVCWRHYGAAKGYTVRQFDFPVSRSPSMSPDDLLSTYESQISPQTRVLVFPHVDNIVGIRYPVRRLARLARQRGVEFVAVDGAQSVGMLPVDVRRMRVDFYAASPHKWLQSPKGLGLLYVRKELLGTLRPMWVTWGQERWKGGARIFEDYGTRNLPEVLALADAVDFQNRLDVGLRLARLRFLREAFRTGVRESARLIWRSPREWEFSAPLFALEVKDKSSAEVFREMNEKGFVFRAFGDPALNTVRISPNFFTGEEEIGRFFEAIERI